MKDRLVTIFERQSALYEKYREHNSIMPDILDIDLTTKEHQQVFRSCAMDMIEELMEAIHHLKNKMHKQSDVTAVDFADFREEMIDQFHYNIELFLLAGFNAETLLEEYIKKNDENLKRIEEGY